MPLRRLLSALFVLVAVAAGAVGGTHAAGPVPIFRVFLKNGSALVCWGEYARVGDRLVLTVPIGSGAQTVYEFVSLPLSRVDFDKTERYAEAVRAAQFAASRGKSEYAALSDRLSAQLASIATLPNPKERLAAAENARQQLIDWAETSHGYRAKEVQQLLQLFDSAIIDLRVAAGESRFAISLSGGTMPPAPVRLRAAPTARETIDLARKAAAASDSGDIRRSLLRRAKAAAAKLSDDDPGNVELKAAIGRDLAAAVRTEMLYQRLEADVRRLAAIAAERGDVLAVAALGERVTRTDRLLGRQRPQEIAELGELLDRERDRAAERRLVLDHWESVRGQVVEYQGDVAPVVKTLDRLAATLTAIQEMSGPPLTSLVTDEQETAALVTLFADLLAPEGASAAHMLFGLAVQQADLAVRTRHRAVNDRDLNVARDASLAAADARIRLAQAKVALATALRPPKAIR